MKVDLYHDRHHKVSWHLARKERQLIMSNTDLLEDIEEEPTEEAFDGRMWHADSKMHLISGSQLHFYKQQHRENEANLKESDSEMMVQGVATGDVEVEPCRTEQVAGSDVSAPQMVEDFEDIVDGVVVSYAEELGDNISTTDDVTFDAVCVQVPKDDEQDAGHRADVAVQENIQLKSETTTAINSELKEAFSMSTVEGIPSKKKTIRSVNSAGDFFPYSDFYGGRRSNQPIERREDRKVQRLVSLAKMHCANRTFSQRPHTNNIQYVQSLGLFYASQPILTTKASTGPSPVSLPNVTRPARTIEVPTSPTSKAATNEKKASRQRLLARRFPWLWHFPSPRSFGKVAHEPFATNEQPHDAPTVEHEPLVRRIVI